MLEPDIREERKDFFELVHWLEPLWEWDYIEWETMESVRFDWNHGEYSLWLFANFKVEGHIPAPITLKVALECSKCQLNHNITEAIKPTN